MCLDIDVLEMDYNFKKSGDLGSLIVSVSYIRSVKTNCASLFPLTVGTEL